MAMAFDEMADEALLNFLDDSQASTLRTPYRRQLSLASDSSSPADLVKNKSPASTDSTRTPGGSSSSTPDKPVLRDAKKSLVRPTTPFTTLLSRGSSCSLDSKTTPTKEDMEAMLDDVQKAKAELLKGAASAKKLEEDDGNKACCVFRVWLVKDIIDTQADLAFHGSLLFPTYFMACSKLSPQTA